MISCKFCGSQFPNEVSLGQHRKAVHPEEGYPCATCDKLFRSRQARHKHKCPNAENICVESKQSEQSGDISCGICDSLLPSMEALCAHLQEIHEQPASIQELSFDVMADYIQWKENVETGGRFEFHQQRKRATKTAVIEYLYCHRSGCNASVAEGKRAPKKLGSIKVGYSCSAFAVVKTFNDNRVTVKYCLDHYLHDNRLARVRIPANVKQQIVRYYEEGRSASWIVEKLRSEVDVSNNQRCFNRHNIITHQEVYNIVSFVGIRKEQFDKDDATSVERLIEHHNSKAALAGELPPFFCYQRQDSKDGIFTLGMQTAFQLEMLKKFGKRAVCIDATHGTQRYKFLLVTVLVVDDFGKGFPAAWFITSNENQERLTDFFSALRNRTGPFECDVFMSDDAPQYFNSWRSVFCGQDDITPRKLLCIWHVLRNWRKQLLSKVQKGNISMVWSTLAIILREQTKATFYNYLSKFVTVLNECEPEFGEYFRNEYASSEERICEWAFWARKGSVVNVNMYLEAFHRTLKKKFLNRNENHRLDFVIAKLFDAAVWYLQDYVVAVERGGHENNYRIKEMHNRHRKSKQFQPADVIAVGPRHWKIKASSKDELYDVIRIGDRCHCKVKCRYCNVCPDIYDCSCPNAQLGTVACKHIHFVCSAIDQSSETPAGDSETVIIHPESEAVPVIDTLSEVAMVDSTELLQYIAAPNVDSISDKKEKVRILLESIRQKTEAMESTDALDECIRKLSIADAYANVYTQHSVSETSAVRRKMAPNKKMATQPRLYQVRKKMKRTEIVLGHPDAATSAAIRENFDELESEVCAVCFQEEPFGDENDVEWVDCDICKNWYHQKCVDIQSAAAVYICKSCA